MTTTNAAAAVNRQTTAADATETAMIAMIMIADADADAAADNSLAVYLKCHDTGGGKSCPLFF